jgi:hypothetical protein
MIQQENFRELLLKIRGIFNSASNKLVFAKRLVVIFILFAVVVWVNFGFIVKFVVDNESIKEDFQESLNQITGLESQINGEVLFDTGSNPKIEINDILIGDSSLEQNSFKISRISIDPNLVSAFMGMMDFTTVNLNKVEISIYSDSQNIPSLNELFNKFYKSDFFEGSNISIKDLTINLYKLAPISKNYYIERKLVFPELSILPNYEGLDIAFKGSLKSKLFEQDMMFQIGFDQNITSGYELKGKIYSENTEVAVEGELSESDGDISVSGKMKAFNKFMFSFLGDNSDFLSNISLKDESEISAKLSIRNKSIEIKQLTVSNKSLNLDIAGKIKADHIYDADLSVKIDRFDFPTFFKDEYEKLSTKRVKDVATDYEERLAKFPLFSIGEDVNFEIEVDVSNIRYFNNQDGHFRFKTSMKDNSFRFYQSDIKFPGDTTLQVLTKSKIDKQKKQLRGRFDFVFEAKNLNQFITGLNLKEKDAKIPQINNTLVKSNGYLYDRKLHFRKIAAKIDQDKASGQMLIDYQNSFTASSAFNIPVLNLNKYFDLSDDPEKSENKIETAEDFSKKLDIFRTIDSFFDELNLSLTTSELIFKENSLEDFAVFIKTTPGVIDVKNSYFRNKILGVFEGKLKVNVKDFQPVIDFDVKVENLNTDYILYDKNVEENDKYNFSGDWSKRRISLEKYLSYEGKGMIRAENFQHLHFKGNNLRLSMDFLGDRIKVNNSRLDIYNSKVDFSGYLTTEFPSFNISFVAANLDLYKVLQNTLGLEVVRGTINASGVLGSTGKNYLEMAEKLKGKISFISKMIEVRGFNFATLSSALPLVKRRKESEIVSNKLLNVGSTKFPNSTVIINIASGEAEIRAIKTENKHIEDLKVEGGVKISDWSINLDTNFLLKTRDKMKVPYRAVTKGSIDNYDINWNVKGAIKYWEEKFYSGRI